MAIAQRFTLLALGVCLILASAGVLLAETASAIQAESGAAADTSAAGRPWVSAYYAGWYWDAMGSSGNPATAIAMVDMTTMTHFIFGTYAPGIGATAGQILEAAGTAHTQVEDGLISKAHTNSVKALMMIGGMGAGSEYADSTASAHRATFITNILNKCITKNYDGVDIDWEEELEGNTTNQNQLKAFLSELRTAAALRSRYQPPNAPFIITFPGFCVNINFLPIEPWRADVAALVDQYNLMSYSQNYAGSGWDSWFFGALKDAAPTHPTSIEASVQAYVDAGVTRSKIGMGIGLYGNYYISPITAPRQHPTDGKLWGNDDNSDYWAALYNAGMLDPTKYTFDAAAQTGYYTYSPAKVFNTNPVTMLTTEDLDSIAAKGAWAKAGNCGGTIVWMINYGYVPALKTNPPMAAIKKAFLGP